MYLVENHTISEQTQRFFSNSPEELSKLFAQILNDLTAFDGIHIDLDMSMEHLNISSTSRPK
jgi:hypothetical protein